MFRTENKLKIDSFFKLFNNFFSHFKDYILLRLTPKFLNAPYFFFKNGKYRIVKIFTLDKPP